MSFHYIHYTTTTTIHLSYSILSLKLPPPPRAVLLVNACLSTVHELEDGHTAPGVFPVGASGASPLWLTMQIFMWHGRGFVATLAWGVGTEIWWEKCGTLTKSDPFSESQLDLFTWSCRRSYFLVRRLSRNNQFPKIDCQPEFFPIHHQLLFGNFQTPPLNLLVHWKG